MKILFYVDPWVDNTDGPEFKCKWLDHFLSTSIKNLYDYAKISGAQNIEIQVLCSDIVETFLDSNKYKWAKFNIITQREIKNLFRSFDHYVSIQKKENNQKNNFLSLNKLISSKLGDYSPDIILLNCSFARHLEYLFPSSLIFFYENGLFSRSPYTPTLYFDCCSNMDDSFLVNNKKNILNYKVDDEGMRFVGSVREFFEKPLRQFNPFKREVESLRGAGYKYLLLFALEHFDSVLFKTSTDYKDQLEYIEHVFQNIGDEIGIIVTEHPICKFIQYEPILNYLTRKYKNFFYIPKTSVYNNSSQFLLQDVDGVITNSSTLGLQSMLYRKPLFVPGERSYLKVFSEEVNLSNIKEYLDRSKYQNKDNVLYWLITRYYVSSDYFETGEWFYTFLRKSFDQRDQRLDMSFYTEIDEKDALFNRLCNRELMKIFIRSMIILELDQRPVKSFWAKLKRWIERKLKLRFAIKRYESENI
jgi:hypothetical protein